MFGETDTVAMTDLKRVCYLPETQDLTEDEVVEVSEHFIKGKYFAEGFRLLPEQADMILQYINSEGLLGIAAAGTGKTLTSFLVANTAFSGKLCEKKDRILMFVPSDLTDQLRSNMEWARKRIHFPAKTYFFKDHGPDGRLALAKSRKPGIYVMGYGLLQTKNAEEILQELSPGLITADECHKIMGKSARSRRVEHYLKANEDCNLVMLSGTMIKRKVVELHKLAQYALRDNLPLPKPWIQAALLSEAMSPTGGMIPMDKIRMCRDLVDWAGEQYNGDARDMTDTLRRAYNKRLRSAPGVFLSTGSNVPSSLIFHIHEGAMEGEGSEELKAYIQEVEATWTTPSGDQFDCALMKFKWINELSQGYFNELQWPEDHPLLEEAQEVQAIKNDLSTQYRKFIEGRHRPGLDTPFLIASNMYLHGSKNVPQEMYDTWRAWKERSANEELPERERSFVRVCDHKVALALKTWEKIDKKDKSGGIVWYYHQGYGTWLVELFKKQYGDRVIHCPSGTDVEALCRTQDLTGKILICSISAHGTGVDGMQKHFRKHLYAQDLHGIDESEQSIARLHRTGQEADEVEVHLLSSSRYDDLKLAGILQNNYFLHLTIGKRRVFEGGWETAPKHFDKSELLEQGVEVPHSLNNKQLTELQEVTG